MKRKILIVLVSIALVGVTCFIFRAPILRSFGRYLVYENPLEKSQVMFVLSGNAYDRGNEAVKVYNDGFAGKIICTGANPLLDFAAEGINKLESDNTYDNILRQGVPAENVALLKQGTSTKEECDAILKYCTENHITSCIVLSSKFHTRRVKGTFSSKFRKAGIHLIIHGAQASQYNESNWWKSEDGLITVNNEYVKLIWYLF